MARDVVLNPPGREQRIQKLREELRSRYGIPVEKARVVNSPYRICPLGAHVDHQDGIVTGMALDQSVLLAFAPSGEPTVRVQSLNFPNEVRFDLHAIPSKVAKDWGNYVRGAALALRQAHKLDRGLVGVVEGDLPIGGLSSSAAVGVAYLLALELVNGLEIDVAENIHLDRFIENGYIGLNNGILDQAVILASRANGLLVIDCQQEAIQSSPCPRAHPAPFRVMVVHSGVNESLTRTDYNQRVAECREAAGQLMRFAGIYPTDGVKLREVSESVFERFGKELPGKLRKRATHFFGEQKRVRDGVGAWERGDLGAFGRLINESGQSSIENYECGCPELITLYELLRECSGVFGARFSGAGFRGSCVALVEPSQAQNVASHVMDEYPKRHPDYAGSFRICFCGTDDGAKVV